MRSCPLASLLAAALVTGCAATSPIDPGLATDLAKTTSEPAAEAFVPVYGLERPVWRNTCQSAPFRGFDFWIGKWDVFGAGQLVGWNEVTSEVGGCAVEEHWTDPSGGRGRSLNTYDAGTRRWNQQWMDATGFPLVVSGQNGPQFMLMQGDTPQGFGGPIITNRIKWTQLGPDQVRQFWEVSLDAQQTWSTAFDGDYRRTAQFSPAAEVPTGFCDAPVRFRFHWFDFLVGTWTVRRGSARGAELGSLSVTKDLSGCLLESIYRGAGGYQGKAFAAFDPPNRVWNRTWIDRDGIRVAVSGGPVGAAMVLSGDRSLPNGAVQRIRITWNPVGPDLVSEQWELSADGGTTWATAWTFTLVRS